MNKRAIFGSPKQQWVGYFAAIAGALLIQLAVAVPAHSGDFYNPYEGPYRGAGYFPSNCHPCGCRPCGCNPCGCNPCGCNPCGCSRCGPIVHRGVLERHWVEREYFERRYATGGNCCRSHGYADGYPGYGNGFGNGYGNGYGYGNGFGGPRPHLGYGGIQYGPHPISNEFDGPLRPPIGIPGPYYSDGYFE